MILGEKGLVNELFQPWRHPLCLHLFPIVRQLPPVVLQILLYWLHFVNVSLFVVVVAVFVQLYHKLLWFFDDIL